MISAKNLRDVCLLGHSAGGKTSVAEAMLYLAKGTDRLGKVTDGNTVCDYDPEEIKRGLSISAALAPLDWKGCVINIIDTPGYLDFAGEVVQATRVADSAIIVVDGKAGLEVGTELAWDYANEARIPKAFFINKCDDPEARFKKVFEQLRGQFGHSVCPVVIPIMDGDKIAGLIDLIDMRAFKVGKNGSTGDECPIPADQQEKVDTCRDMLLESLAETSDELMEKYFAGEEITREEANKALHDGIVAGSIAPVVCGSAAYVYGIKVLLDIIADSFPSPLAVGKEIVMDGDEEKEIPMDENGKTAIFVFKTVADPFVGKMSFFKVMNGKLNKDDTLYNITSGGQEKFSHVYILKGKKQKEIEHVCMGDLGMTPKLANTNTNDTLSADPNALPYKKIKYPEPFYQMAMQPKAKGDEEKITQGVARLLEEDRTLKYENNAETKQMLISGLGDIHLDVVLSKLKSRFGTSIDLVPPKVAYRETIKKRYAAEGKHKKQSGGSGQYGHVKITFSPGEDPGLTFTQSVVGGSVPKNYYPAVEKGLQEAMIKGVLAGFPVVNLAADLFDGSYHPVDSNEISFKLAAILAYKEGMKNAGPVILEPVGKLCAYAPDSMVGDIMGMVNKRRGRVLGMEPTQKKGEQLVEAEVPMAEMADFAIQLRAITQGRGKYTLYFDHYEEVPATSAAKIIEEAKKDMQD